MKRIPFLVIALLAATLAVPAVAQDAMKKDTAVKPADPELKVVVDSWNDIGRKLIAMAEDFPEDKYDFKPTPAQRSFAEQLLHAAGQKMLRRWRRRHPSERREGPVRHHRRFLLPSASSCYRLRLRFHRALRRTLRPAGCLLPPGGSGPPRIPPQEVAGTNDDEVKSREERERSRVPHPSRVVCERVGILTFDFDFF